MWNVAHVRAALLAWYDEDHRELPWRSENGAPIDPYEVWVSEVMLQQTRVETVRPYFTRWIERFPTVEALADAETDDVLKSWEGLGYYSRARSLHRAAREVVARYGAVVPSDAAELRSLPGIGRYTAGAVSSIAYGKEEPVVDGNVRRVLARWLDQADPLDDDLWRIAADLVAGERPGDLNQALMELGAMICRPRNPECGRCPVRASCLAYAAGTTGERPAPKKKAPLPLESYGVGVIVDGGHVLIVRRPPNGRLGSMWEFPSALINRSGSAAAAGRSALAGLGVAPPADMTPLGTVSHTFTHVRVSYEIVCGVLSDDHARKGVRATGKSGEGAAWVTADELAEFAMPVAQRRIAARIPGFERPAGDSASTEGHIGPPSR